MKACPDCGAENENDAVTCTDCGSLFADQVGVDVGKRRRQDIVPTAPPALEDASTTATRGSTVLICDACGAINSANHVRCQVCGSDRLVRKAPGTGAGKGRRRRLTAWERRPRKGVVDGEFPDVSSAEIYTFICLSVLKLLLCTALGAQIVIGNAGPKGLHPTTYAWKWAVGPTMLADAFLASVGAVGLLYLRKYGAAFLSLSFVLDVLLLLWLVYFNSWGTLNVWPGSGPYIFLACVCASCAIELAHKAVKGDML